MNPISSERAEPLLDWAIEYRLHCRYPSKLPPLTENQKKSVRRKAQSIEVDNYGKCFVERQKRRVEVIRSPQERVRIFREYHSGHLGWQKTWEAIARNFYWKGLSDDVKDWVAKCDDCQRRLNKKPARTGRSSSDIGLPQQVSASYDHEDNAQRHSYCVTVPHHVPPGDTGHCDSAYEEASGRQFGSIEPETGRGNNVLALSVDRHAPSTLYPLAMKMQPSYMNGPCSSANPTEPKMFRGPEQATDDMEVDSQCGMMLTFRYVDGRTLPVLLRTPLGDKNLMGNLPGDDLITSEMETSSPGDDLINAQMETGQLQPMYSSSAQERHAPPTPSLGNGAYLPIHVPMQQSYMTEVYGNDSVSTEYPGTPCASDRRYLAITPMTPLEEQGGPYVTDDLLRRANTPEDRHLLIHGQLTEPMDCTVSPPMAKDPRVHVDGPDMQLQDGRTTSTHSTVQLSIPPTQCKTRKECIQADLMEGTSGYDYVVSLFTYVKWLVHHHSKSQRGHGAFSSLRLLIPKLSKLAHAMKLRGLLPTEEHFTYSFGVADDIISLLDILKESLSNVYDRHIHVSQKLLCSLQFAANKCYRTGVDVATIAQALNVGKHLCVLHIKFPQHGRMHTLSVVCYEGEIIYEIVNSACLDGETVDSYCFDLFHDKDSMLPVVKKSTTEGVFPVYNIYLVHHTCSNRVM